MIKNLINEQQNNKLFIKKSQKTPKPKPMTCPKCTDLHHKLKLLKSDYQFQIKKIQQDKSTQKAIYQIHLQKQIRKWQDAYQKQKILRDDQTKNWIQKYDKTVDKYQEEIKQCHKKYQKQLEFEKTNLGSTMKKQLSTLRTQYQQKIHQLNQNFQNKLTSLTHSHQLQTIQLNSQHQTIISQIKKTHKTLLQQKIKIYQSKLLGLQSEKITEKKLYEDSKNQWKDIQGKLYKQIFQLRKNITEIENKLHEQIKDTKYKQEFIQQLQNTINKIKNDHQLHINEVKMEGSKAVEQCKQKYNGKLSDIYKQTLAYCNQYQDSLIKMSETRQSERGIYLNNIQQINMFVQSRASRPEDVQQIEYLRHKLSKKIKQCDGLIQQLKFFRLELQNKQQTYNKIFMTASNNQNVAYKRKQFKLRRQGKSITTVREVLQSLNSANAVDRKSVTVKPKIL